FFPIVAAAINGECTNLKMKFPTGTRVIFTASAQSIKNGCVYTALSVVLIGELREKTGKICADPINKYCVVDILREGRVFVPFFVRNANGRSWQGKGAALGVTLSIKYFRQPTINGCDFIAFACDVPEFVNPSTKEVMATQGGAHRSPELVHDQIGCIVVWNGRSGESQVYSSVTGLASLPSTQVQPDMILGSWIKYTAQIYRGNQKDYPGWIVKDPKQMNMWFKPVPHNLDPAILQLRVQAVVNRVDNNRNEAWLWNDQIGRVYVAPQHFCDSLRPFDCVDITVTYSGYYEDVPWKAIRITEIGDVCAVRNSVALMLITHDDWKVYYAPRANGNIEISFLENNMFGTTFAAWFDFTSGEIQPKEEMICRVTMYKQERDQKHIYRAVMVTPLDPLTKQPLHHHPLYSPGSNVSNRQSIHLPVPWMTPVTPLLPQQLTPPGLSGEVLRTNAQLQNQSVWETRSEVSQSKTIISTEEPSLVASTPHSSQRLLNSARDSLMISGDDLKRTASNIQNMTNPLGDLVRAPIQQGVRPQDSAVSFHIGSMDSQNTTDNSISQSIHSHATTVPIDISNSEDNTTTEQSAHGLERDPPIWITISNKLKYDIHYKLGEGSLGTVVFRGKLEDRDVAVKRVQLGYASKEKEVEREVANLIKADSHPNVIQYFCTESDDICRFIVLELCEASLHDYVKKETIRESVDISSDELLRQTTVGLAYLHIIKIVHRDLKPQNVLIYKKRGEPSEARISDFGLSKTLRPNKNSVSCTGSRAVGTVGYIAPEVIDGQNASPRSDIFSLGCVFFYVLSKGFHPYGPDDDREENMKNGAHSMEGLVNRSELTSDRIKLATNIISLALSQNAKDRPSAHTIWNHPYFWSTDKQLTFFCEVSDRIVGLVSWSPVLQRVEENKLDLTGGNWLSRICAPVFEALSKHRKSENLEMYTGLSVRELLRVIRNVKHHYRNFLDDAQEALGGYTKFLSYFYKRFPDLLRHVHKAMECCSEEPIFNMYYSDEVRSRIREERQMQDNNISRMNQNYSMQRNDVKPNQQHAVHMNTTWTIPETIPENIDEISNQSESFAEPTVHDLGATPVPSTPFAPLQQSSSFLPSFQKSNSLPANFKREICVYFKKGNCKKEASQCTYSHNYKAQRRAMRNENKNYKKEICVNFEKNGRCPYGDQCNRIHTDDPEYDDACKKRRNFKR
ncbi:hypothetical protein PENTCL1PPCAC_4827, partial [Pristionchus entomophagus]